MIERLQLFAVFIPHCAVAPIYFKMAHGKFLNSWIFLGRLPAHKL
jgi:hypothetical protein